MSSFVVARTSLRGWFKKPSISVVTKEQEDIEHILTCPPIRCRLTQNFSPTDVGIWKNLEGVEKEG
jgi:hypothetical protein